MEMIGGGTSQTSPDKLFVLASAAAFRSACGVAHGLSNLAEEMDALSLPIDDLARGAARAFQGPTAMDDTLKFSIAGELVRIGARCDHTVSHLGLSFEETSGKYRMLEHIAVDGPAKARIAEGDPVDQVANAYGIEKGSGPYRMLEGFAVNGPAKARIAAGEPVDQVASALGIERDSDAYIKLERMA